MYSRTILIGNVGGDPETKHLDNDKQVTNFSMATQNYYGGKEHTTWHNIVLWDKLSGIAEKYISKGDRVMIEGRINKRSYENKEGQTVEVTEIYGDVLKLLTPKKEKETRTPVVEDSGDELPF